MASTRLNLLADEGRELLMKYVGNEERKHCRSQASLLTQRFRSSLCTIFFEPRLSAFYRKLYQMNIISP